MPAVWESAEVIAIFLADIHLSIKAPIWRSAEPNWLAAQARPLLEVKNLQLKYKCPVICAGDIFERNRKTADGWNASPELINYALEYLPDNMYSIPGQHDLPNHQYEDIHRSAYCTLVKAGKIINITPGGALTIGKHLILSAFPPGYEITPVNGCKDDRDEGDIWVAITHQYRCIEGKAYPTAPGEAYFHRNETALMGYDVIVYGDNHKGFMTDVNKKSLIFNCGTLMRRKSDELDYKPQIGMLLESGMVAQYFLDTSEDKYLDIVELAGEEEPDLNMSEFFSELEKLGNTALEFVDAMKHYMNSVDEMSPEAKQIVLRVMEN